MSRKHYILSLVSIALLASACGPADENNATSNNMTSNNKASNNTASNNMMSNSGDNHKNHENHTTENSDKNNVSDNSDKNNTTENSAQNNVSDNSATFEPIDTPTTYTFPSRFADGESSVSYSGQTARHILINDLNIYINTQLENDALSNTAFGSKEDFEAALLFWFEFDSDSNGDSMIITGTTPDPAQTTYNDISTGKDIVGKLAGNDDKTDHKDWDAAGNFEGWSDDSIAANGGSIDSPEGLVRAYLATMAKQAFDLSEGNAIENPYADENLPVYVTENGLDLKQLTQKTILMAVTFSQAADDYMGDDVDEKGLLAANTQAEGKNYSGLEHAWDEAFGYFGAAADYGDYTDEEIAKKGGRDDWQGHHDSDGDGKISFKTEYNFGAAVNAAKRDRGSADAAKTDFTKDAFDAFLEGRTLITNAGDEVSADELAKIKEQRDIAISAWEKAIAATVVHYINDVLQDMGSAFNPEAEYSFLDHAKHWGELKGFAIGLQFNPSSPMLEGTRFVDFHNLVGDAPVLPNKNAEEIEAYREKLIEARGILKEAYGFDDANMGDRNGEGGW